MWNCVPHLLLLTSQLFDVYKSETVITIKSYYSTAGHNSLFINQIDCIFCLTVVFKYELHVCSYSFFGKTEMEIYIFIYKSVL